MPGKRDTIGNSNFHVGCGYAAHRMVHNGGVAVLVVRIANGMSWVIPHTPEFQPYDPIGVTCDEVFLLGEIGGRSTIARVRIDSLGPPLPPD